MKAEDKTSPINLLQRWKWLKTLKLPIDEVDIKILDALSKNCRVSNIKIAKKLKLSEATVRRRIRIMEEKGVLLGYSVHINFALIEESVKTYISLKVAKRHKSSIVETLCRHPSSLAVYSITGDYNVLAVMFFQNEIEYNDFIEMLNQMNCLEHSIVQTVVIPYKGRIW